MRVRFKALDKDSKGNFSREAVVNGWGQLSQAEKEFNDEVPFVQWYTDHEFVSGSNEEEAYFDAWNLGT